MKLTGIEIEQFGVWRNFSQTLHPSGLNVFYGPNEAGKTTLLRFIRGVLFGFRGDERPGSRRAGKRLPQSGALHVTHRGAPYEIRRASRGDDLGLLSISGVEGGESSSRFIQELVSGTDEKLFESVFAVGLPELQEFSTLAEDQVARHLYGMTLGPKGQLLMDLPGRINAELEKLWPKDGHRGRIPELLELQREGLQQLQGLRPQRERYRTLIRQRRDLEQQIAGLKKRHGDLQQQLRGCQFLEKIWAPWQRVREHRRELSGIPDLRTFPPDGLGRLVRLETDRDALVRTRDDVLRDIRNIGQRLQECNRDDSIRRFAGSIRALSEQRRQWDDYRQQMLELERQAAEHDRELTTQLAAIGPGWNLARLEAVTDTPEAHGRFVAAARQFQQVRTSLRRRQRRYRRWSAASRDRELALRTEMQHLGVAGEDFDQPLAVAKERLALLTELGRLQLHAADMRQRNTSVDEQLQRLRDRLGLPDWVWVVLAFFVLAGVGLICAGVSAGMSTGWLVGAIYVALALTAGGTTWALKLEFERDLQEQVADLRDQRAANDSRLFDAERRIRQLVEQLGLRDPETGQLVPTDATDGELLSRAADRLAQLEAAQRAFQRILDTRQQLSVLRGRLQGHQRELATARRTWCDTLKSLGYDERVDVEAAFQQWQAVTAARELRRKGADARRELRGLRDDWERFRAKVEDLGRRMRAEGLDYAQPFVALDRWDADLRAWIAGRQEYRRLLKDRKTRRAEADDLQKRIDQFQQQIAALLQQAHATDRADLERKLQLYQRRQQVELLLQQATRDLEALAQAESDLAIVEDDLVRYQPQANADTIRRVTREADDVERQLQELFEQLGTIKQEVKALSADRQGSRARFDLHQTQERLKDAWEGWYAAAVSEEIVDLVGALFEQSNQPEMLAAAIPFVERLTCGKYQRLWTQLGRKQLFVDDDRAQPRPAEQLSGGTREQLFLAIRLAMVKAFADHGVELPMVLDDVTVNFDQQRSEAAVDTLQEFVKEGQQVLVFTSHLFFAQMFQQRGIEPIWLPARDRRSEERMAG